MHLKVFVKLNNTLKTPSSGQKNPKKPKKTQNLMIIVKYVLVGNSSYYLLT
jgi:hypothetical protein